MGYEVDASMLDSYLQVANAPPHLVVICEKLKKTVSQLENPRSAGGEYRNNWYYVSGKYQIKAKIDDEAKMIYLIKYIKLP